MNRGKKILLSIIGVLLLITSIVGVSYAYFTSMIAGNDKANPTVVTTGTMKIEYTNSQEITGEQLLPGWQSGTKTFTVKNTGTLPVVYNIQITNVINTFADTVDSVSGHPEELVYTLIRDGKTILEEQQFPSTNNIIASDIEIEKNEIHTYQMKVEFKEIKTAQNYNQGRSFFGKIEIGETELAKTIVLEGDTSNANAPELNNGLIPVTWTGREWVKADTTKAWYNYDNQAWANAVTVTSSSRSTYTSAAANTPISMDDIETMWVWIPRYEYQHSNLGDNYTGSKTAPDSITINFISKDTTTPSSDNFTVHNSFWWDDNNDSVKDANEQLPGIWVAKFEMSSDIVCEATSDDVGVNCDVTNVTPQIKPSVTSWRGARIGTFWTAIHENMNGENNIYGLMNSDVHLMKNIEWGAVAYLSQSKYGKYGNTDYIGTDKEIYVNKSEEYITGSSNGTPNKRGYNVQAKYDIEKQGTGASTTGNIYGIYDMSGGAKEYVMGVMRAGASLEPAVGLNTIYNSGWGGKVYNAGSWTNYTGTYGRLGDDSKTEDSIEGIGKKYYDLYAYGLPNTITGKTRYHKGDATYETVGWYSNGHVFPYVQQVPQKNCIGPFFTRGGEKSTSSAGAFAYSAVRGSAFIGVSSRPVLTSLS